MYDNFSRALDNYIEGVNDPNNPANQTNWDEDLSVVLEVATWVSDEMLEDPNTNIILEQCFTDAVNEILGDSYYSSTEYFLSLKKFADGISEKAKEKYQKEFNKNLD